MTGSGRRRLPRPRHTAGAGRAAARGSSVGGLLCTTLLAAGGGPASAQTDGLDVLEYRLSVRADLEREGVWVPLNTLSATARITFANRVGSPVRRVPVVLHRLLDVEAVRTGGGRSLEFDQRLTALEGWAEYQAKAVSVLLDGALAPGDTLTLQIDYAGGLRGVP